MSRSLPKLYRRFAYTLVVLVALSLSVQHANAQLVSYESDDGWNLGVTGAIPVFFNLSDHEDFNSDGSNQFSSRVMSGFNPGNVTFTVTAPEQNGVTVSGVFQINHHLQGASIQNDGLFEGRVADIILAGDFGSINIGKGLGVFQSISIADAGSGMGVGRFAGPDAADATLGRIGAGYTYANFNPRIIYNTPDLGGFGLSLGLVNPEKPRGAEPEEGVVDNFAVDIETPAPRFEGQADYTIGFDAGSLRLWAGGLYQYVDVISENFNYNITGWDVGARLNAAGFGLTGSYSETSGIGSDGLIGLALDIDGDDANRLGGLTQAEMDGQQWYVEGTYDFGGFIVGASYGEGIQDGVTNTFGSFSRNTNQLIMGFTRLTVTDNLTFMLEVQDFQSQAQADYNAFIVGAQLTF